MTSKDIVKLVAATIDRYEIREVNAYEITKVIQTLGYRVCRYGPCADDDVLALLEKENLTEAAAAYDSFTCKTKTLQAVFIKEGIADEEYVYLLCKELGRILTARHAGGLLGVCVDDERTASVFASHISSIPERGILFNFFKYHAAQCAVVFAVVYGAAVLACGYLFTNAFGTRTPLVPSSPFEVIPASTAAQNTTVSLDDVRASAVSVDEDLPVTEAKDAPESEADTDALVLLPRDDVPDASGVERTADDAPENVPASTASFTPSGYYATASGGKYHKLGCSYLKSTPIEVSMEDIQSGKYTPCSKCFK